MSRHIEDAAVARTNLTIFHAVVAVLEGGTVKGASADKAAARIIEICKAEAYRQLLAMDAATEKAERELK